MGKLYLSTKEIGANNDTPNEELDYQIKTTTAKLSSMGINVEDLTL